MDRAESPRSGRASLSRRGRTRPGRLPLEPGRRPGDLDAPRPCGRPWPARGLVALESDPLGLVDDPGRRISIGRDGRHEPLPDDVFLPPVAHFAPPGRRVGTRKVRRSEPVDGTRRPLDDPPRLRPGFRPDRVPESRPAERPGRLPAEELPLGRMIGRLPRARDPDRHEAAGPALLRELWALPRTAARDPDREEPRVARAGLRRGWALRPDELLRILGRAAADRVDLRTVRPEGFWADRRPCDPPIAVAAARASTPSQTPIPAATGMRRPEFMASSSAAQTYAFRLAGPAGQN